MTQWVRVRGVSLTAMAALMVVSSSSFAPAAAAPPGRDGEATDANCGPLGFH